LWLFINFIRLFLLELGDTVSGKSEDSSSNTGKLIAAIVVPILVIIAVMLFVAYCIKRRKRTMLRRENKEDIGLRNLFTAKK
jgi:flagellar biogenesis protein FliO